MAWDSTKHHATTSGLMIIAGGWCKMKVDDFKKKAKCKFGGLGVANLYTEGTFQLKAGTSEQDFYNNTISMMFLTGTVLPDGESTPYSCNGGIVFYDKHSHTTGIYCTEVALGTAVAGGTVKWE